VVPFGRSRGAAWKDQRIIAKKNLPARLSRLTRGLAIIFVREAIAPATAFAAPSAIAATAAIPATTAARTPATAAARSGKSTAAGTRSPWRSAFSLGPCFIHFQIAPTGFFAIQTRDRLRRFFVIRHFHEREATSSSRFAVHGHVHARHLAKGLEQRPKIAFRRLEIHVPNKKTFHVASPSILMRRWRENAAERLSHH
jgi:hypothetical protein